MKTPIIAVGMMTSREVPTATFGFCEKPISKIMAGTITTPPPTPNKPLEIPPIRPITPAIKYWDKGFIERDS